MTRRRPGRIFRLTRSSVLRELDGAVAAVDGHGFRTTPVVRAASIAEQIGSLVPGNVWVKDETGNVSGSHKARHLMAVMLEMRVAEAVAGVDPRRPLAIASCGNAALAAAVVARAADRRLMVLVPPHAEAPVLTRLADLGATVHVCPRLPGQAGDPSYLQLQAAIDGGAVPFTCQGNENGLVSEGGALDTVQTQGAWPLKRAFDRVATGIRRSVRLPATRPPNQATTSPPGQERSTS